MAMLSLTSCSDTPEHGDSTLWKGEITPPTFADNAVSFKIDDSDLYSYIELSESGMYFITLNEPDDEQTDHTPMRSRSDKYYDSDESSIISGIYSVISKTEFKLEDFGTITYIAEDGTINLIYLDGKKLKLKAKKQKQIQANKLNDRLCRTWEIKNVRVESFNKDMEPVGTHTLTPQEMRDEYVKSFTFTRSGRMYEYDYDGSCVVYNWYWSNSSSQIFVIDDGPAQVYFDNNTATFMVPSVEIEFDSQFAPVDAHYQKEYIACTQL